MMRAQILSSTTVAASDAQSQAIDLRRVKDFSVQVNVTAASTPSGSSVKLQMTNYDPSLGNWDDISSTSTSISAAGALMIPQQSNIGYRWARIYITKPTSGSITLDGIIAGHEYDED